MLTASLLLLWFDVSRKAFDCSASLLISKETCRGPVTNTERKLRACLRVVCFYTRLYLVTESNELLIGGMWKSDT